jgi:hypothetical protein
MRWGNPIRLLQWVLCAVLAFQSGALLLRSDNRSATSIALAAVELGAIALFLVPRTLLAGAILLAGVLAVAFARHLTRMGGPPLGFLVYGAAIWVVVQEARGARVARG